MTAEDENKPRRGTREPINDLPLYPTEAQIARAVLGDWPKEWKRIAKVLEDKEGLWQHSRKHAAVSISYCPAKGAKDGLEPSTRRCASHRAQQRRRISRRVDRPEYSDDIEHEIRVAQ
jgi:hypothetical protein